MSKICVIVPMRGYSDYLEKTVKSLIEIDYHDYDIIYVDDGLDEAAIAILKLYPDKIRIIKCDGRGPSYARNLGAENTDAEYVAFTDSDCIVDKNWLKELMKGFEEAPDAVSCGGVQDIPSDATDFEKTAFLFMRKIGFVTDYMRTGAGLEMKMVKHNASCNVMYKRNVFLQEGGFFEGLWPGEDVEFDYG